MYITCLNFEESNSNWSFNVLCANRNQPCTAIVCCVVSYDLAQFQEMGWFGPRFSFIGLHAIKCTSGTLNCYGPEAIVQD